MSRFIVSPHAQQTPEWFQDRLGMVTGSGVAAVFAKIKSGEAATRANYRMSLVLERVTKVPTPNSFAETEDIAWGKEQEPFSRMAFDIATGLSIEETGFIYLPTIKAGCSLDGFVTEGGKRGFWESKSPKSKNHYATIKANDVPSEYRPQLIHNFWISGADFCYYQSYDPRMPEKLRIFLKRIERADVAQAIDEHERGVLQFLAEVDAEERDMRERAGLD